MNSWVPLVPVDEALLYSRRDPNDVRLGDVVHAAEPPGVNDLSPMGLTAVEVCEIADVAAMDPRTRVIEVTEVNPTHDVGGITARLAANIIVRALARV